MNNSCDGCIYQAFINCQTCKTCSRIASDHYVEGFTTLKIQIPNSEYNKMLERGSDPTYEERLMIGILEYPPFMDVKNIKVYKEQDP